MFSYEEYNKLYNAGKENEYRESREKLGSIRASLASSKEKGFREKVIHFLSAQAELLDTFCELEAKRDEAYLSTASLRELQADQELIWKDILPENYKESFANPDFCGSCFGRLLGPVMASVSAYFREGAGDIDTHRRFLLTARLRFFFTLHYHMTHERVLAENVSALLRRQRIEHLSEEMGLAVLGSRTPADRAVSDRIETASLAEPYYLYMLGGYVSEEAIRCARFMMTLPEEEIEKAAVSLAEAYSNGLSRARRDIRRKKTLCLHYPLGMERLAAAALSALRSKGWTVFAAAPSFTHPNPQYLYDHANDTALILNEEYAAACQKEYDKLYEENSAALSAFGGTVNILSFGNQPFVPEKKALRPEYKADQRALIRKTEADMAVSRKSFAEEANESSTAVAYPSPLIGENFEVIFRELLKLNADNAGRLERVQSSLINALDKGSAVTIIGKAPNETRLTVSLTMPENPRRQNGFFSCLADYELPAGEIYTTPRLAGTNGLLHIEKLSYRGYSFENLKLTFEDGLVSSWSCSDCPDAEEGSRLMAEVLFAPLETLPLGQLSIGTNTALCCLAERYSLDACLPELLRSKISVQFVLGDSCFAGTEETAVFNPDRKEMIARENEKTALRREDPTEAYTHVRIPLSLAFLDIEKITVITEKGSNDLIRSGRFVLPGADILNEPFLIRDMQAAVTADKENEDV